MEDTVRAVLRPAARDAEGMKEAAKKLKELGVLTVAVAIGNGNC